MFRLKSIGVMSVAKISGIFYFAISLLIVPFFFLAAVASTFAPKGEGQLPGVFLAFIALLAPFLYGAMGFVFGALAAWIYNLVAGWIGGIEMQFEGPPQPPPQTMRPPIAPSPIAQP